MRLAEGRERWAESGGTDGLILSAPGPHVHLSSPMVWLSGWTGSIESTDSLKMDLSNLPVSIKGECLDKGRG